MTAINISVLEDVKTFEEIVNASLAIEYDLRRIGGVATSIIMRPDQRNVCMAMATPPDYVCADGVDTFCGLPVRINNDNKT